MEPCFASHLPFGKRRNIINNHALDVRSTRRHVVVAEIVFYVFKLFLNCTFLHVIYVKTPLVVKYKIKTRFVGNVFDLLKYIYLYTKLSNGYLIVDGIDYSVFS